MSLLEKYKPTLKNWGTVLCGAKQRKALALFLNGSDKQLILFTGPTGVGKTTIARLIAESWGVEPTHISCRNVGISGVREAIDSFGYKPLMGNKKVYFFDEVDALSNQAQQSLLVDIENVPDYVYVFAATLYPDKLRTDFRSRFYPVNLTVPTRKEVGVWLQDILTAEGIDLPREVGTEIINRAQGSFRLILHALQNYVDGLDLAPNTEEEHDFVKAVFSQKFSTTDLMKIPIESYEGVTVGLCNYAIAILQRTSEGQMAVFASRVLAVFGDGLPQNMPANISFYKRLLGL